MILIRKCNGIFNLFAVFYILCCFSFTLVAQVTKRNVKDIDTVYICNLPSNISYANSYKEPIYNEYLSDSSSRLFTKAFKSQIPKRIISSELVFFNSLENEQFQNQLNNIIVEAEKIKKLKNIKNILVPDSLLRTLSNKNVKFLFVTFNSGFTRDKNRKYDIILAENYIKSKMPFSIFFEQNKKSNSTVIWYVIDIENKNILHYWKDSEESEPLIEKSLKFQSKFILDSYFNPFR
jgi:hypothetical protein